MAYAFADSHPTVNVNPSPWSRPHPSGCICFGQHPQVILISQILLLLLLSSWVTFSARLFHCALLPWNLPALSFHCKRNLIPVYFFAVLDEMLPVFPPVLLGQSTSPHYAECRQNCRFIQLCKRTWEDVDLAVWLDIIIQAGWPAAATVGC